ncbi:peroxidase-related enzyme [Aureispira anguillae]|uniref:Peroxidase-related enzyme n=1 Tax=Aureispira anguillae TaxID=2864201 RepID=A0A915YLH7_9BACT|nr:peroxidase-related enzyme [Aureispira anguillae]BDS15285.1 peroxidase-related enzyme [Aureispira anguillae]
MAHIKVIEHGEAEGELKEIYDELIKTRGKLAEVHKIQSLNPATIMAHMDLYMKIMFGKSPLRRYQREMMAVVVSVCNNCLYCTEHHAEAVRHFWKDAAKVDQLIADYTQVDLSEIDQLYCQLAKQLTQHPSQTSQEKYLKPLKDLGVDDRAILDATLVIAYFNFVNRIVLGLGVHLESKTETTGYHYD